MSTINYIIDEEYDEIEAMDDFEAYKEREYIKRTGDSAELLQFDIDTDFRFCPDSELPF